MINNNFEISIRPEIRKGCLWDIQFSFSQEFLKENELKELVIDKNQKSYGYNNENVAFLCLKVRSKLLDRELGLNKVCEIERQTIAIHDSGIAILKVKFTQRPRSVFHKHSDVMILVATIRSLRTNEIIANNEVELIFRGGTGSCHSAESKKRKVQRNHKNPSSVHHQQIYSPISPMDDENGSSSEETESYYHHTFQPLSPTYPNKKICVSHHNHNNSNINEDVDELISLSTSSFMNFDALDDPFYINQLNDINESIELIEWSKKEGLFNDNLLLESNMGENECYEKIEEVIQPHEEGKIDIKEEMRKFKEEMMIMINEKIESFKRRMDEKMERRMRGFML